MASRAFAKVAAVVQRARIASRVARKPDGSRCSHGGELQGEIS
jgi:hypothetical protein